MTPDPDDPHAIASLWDKVAQLVKAREDLNWGLCHSTNPKVAHFLQMGPGGTNMKCLFIPRIDEKEGTGQVIFELGPREMQVALAYVREKPDGLLCTPLTFPMHLEGNAEKDGARPAWQNGGALFAHAHIVSTASLELYERIAPWYVDCLEGICKFLSECGEWYRAGGKDRLDQPRV
jgi:hypothetical protein